MTAPLRPLMQFKSHIAGKNADVMVYADRIEWRLARGISGGKVTAGLLTGGVSMLATGVRSGKAGSEMLPIAAVTSVGTKRDGLINTIVNVATSSGVIAFRVPHRDAGPIEVLLRDLALGRHASQRFADVEPSETSPPPREVPSQLGAGLADLERLAELHRSGVLTDEEFSSAKARALGL